LPVSALGISLKRIAVWQCEGSLWQRDQLRLHRPISECPRTRVVSSGLVE
jgi:hypothetical protein